MNRPGKNGMFEGKGAKAKREKEEAKAAEVSFYLS